MNLTIYNQEGVGTLPEIQWNYEELKQYALSKAKDYQSIAYTDADVAEMKKDRADINRFINALEDARKRKKKEYLAPYEKFEAQIKDALVPLRQTTALIGQKLDEVEQQYRAGRMEKMREYYQQNVGNLQDLIPFERTVREEYYKRSFSDKKLKQAYEELFVRIVEEFKALDELPERFRDKATLKYMESFNLSDALRESRRLEELERAMEECRKKQEEVRQEAAENEAKVRATVVNQPETQGIPEETAQKEILQERTVISEVKAEEEPVLRLDFRVWGTREQLMRLRLYMIDQRIKFGKVE